MQQHKHKFIDNFTEEDFDRQPETEQYLERKRHTVIPDDENEVLMED